MNTRQLIKELDSLIENREKLKAVKALIDFLNNRKENKVLHLKEAKEYIDLYSLEHSDRAKRLVNSLISEGYLTRIKIIK